MNGGILFFSEGGKAVAEKVQQYQCQWTVFDKEKQTAKAFVKEQFFTARVLVFIGAVGIAVRYLSGLPKSKDQDPAVLVIDEKMQYVIPILSGHLGGANRLATCLATLLQARPVITTSTDVHGVFAVDVWTRKHQCTIENINEIKTISSALLNGETVWLDTDLPVMGSLPQGIQQGETGEKGIVISYFKKGTPFLHTLNVIPKQLVLGVGCRKNIPVSLFESVVSSILEEKGIYPQSIGTLASIDLKKEEPCLVSFAEKRKIPFVTFTAAQLATAQGYFTPSPFVLETVQVDNVCERSGWMVNQGNFLVRKTKCHGITIAITAPEWSVHFECDHDIY